MLFFRKRNIKIIWRLLIISFVFIFLTITITLALIKFNVYSYIYNERFSLIDNLLYKTVKNLSRIFYNYDLEKSFNMLNLSKVEDNILLDKGSIFIYNADNIKIYSNNNINNEKDYFVNDYWLKNRIIQNLLSGNFNIDKIITTKNNFKFIKYKIKRKNYLLFFYEHTDKSKNKYFKIMYLFPFDIFIFPIYQMLFLILLLFCFVFFFFIIFVIMTGNSITFPIKRFNYAIERVSQGYLDINMVSDSKDEIGYLFKNFNRMIKTNIDILANIQKSSNNIKGYQNSINKIIADFDSRLNQQKKLIVDCIEKFNDLNTSINNINQNIKNAKSLVDQTQIYSDNSSNIINEMSGDIDRIAETIDQVNFITELINIISEKTRLIAVNSAIEASRAGEAGKSFGVVADEIRKLARLSHNAANEIGELIKINEKRISLGVNRIKEVVEILNNVNSSIKMVSNIVENITEDNKKESQYYKSIVNTNNSISEKLDENIKSMSSLDRMKNLLNQGVDNIRSIANAFILKSDKTEVIKDFYYSTKDEKEELKIEKIQRKNEKKQLIKTAKENKKIERLKTKKTKKLDTVRALALYKPKKSIFNK